LEEGNVLRKLLIKKGLGEVGGKKQVIHDKFVAGCLEKGISKEDCEDLWDKMSAFSTYSFNRSHAAAYSILSYICAHLLTYNEPEWICSYLDNEDIKDKETALSIAKSLGFSIKPPDINFSGVSWEVSPGTKELLTPLTNIKGLGDVAIEQITKNRPFSKIEDVLFNENILYSKLNKKGIDALIKSGALSSLMDQRFKNLRHFWLSCVGDERPKTLKKFNENVEKFKNEQDFSQDEKFEFFIELSGYYPIDFIITPLMREKLNKVKIPMITERQNEQFCWFVIKEIFHKKTKKGKAYIELKVADDSNKDVVVRCWNTNDDYVLMRNKLYFASLDYDPNYGFSTRNILKNFKVIG
jgi:DNA polymerase III alpha subunit